MAEKRYYWLKLQTDFFRQKEIKKLRSIAGGDTYTIIYLKMLLASLETEGKLYYEGIEDDFASEIALEINEDVENVRVVVSFLLSKNLMVSDDDTYTLEKLASMTGSESASAERKRRERDKKRLTESVNADFSLNCEGVTKNNAISYPKSNVFCSSLTKERDNVTSKSHLSHVDIEKEKEKDIEIDKEKINKKENDVLRAKALRTRSKEKPPKHEYGEYKNVLLSDSDLEKLKKEFPDDYQQRIENLSIYMKSKGKAYKDHLATIRNWARMEEARKTTAPKSNAYSKPTVKESLDDFYQMVSDWSKAEPTATEATTQYMQFGY